MSKIIEFIDKVVEFPLRWTANIGGNPENITDLTRDPGTVYQAGTANKAEFFNAIQENGVFSVGSTIGIAGSVTTYTTTGFIVDGTFTIFEGFKMSMKSSGDNVGVSKIDLLGTVYDVKVSNKGSYTDTSDNDIKTNDIILLEYRNGVFVYNNSLPKGVGLVAGSAKDLEDKIKNNSSKEILFDGSKSGLGEVVLSENWDNFEEIIFIGYGTGTFVNIQHSTFYTDYVVPSEDTAPNQPNEYRVYNTEERLISLYFRGIDKTKLYICENKDSIITQVIGKGRK